MNVRELDSLIGSLLFVGVRGSDPEREPLRDDLRACAQARVGGVILFDRDAADGAERNIINPRQTLRLCRAIRTALGPDVLLGVDQEGGAVARLRPELGFKEAPSASCFATMPERERARAAVDLAAQVVAAGFDCNFAPCVDVASNPDNTVVVQNGRCFSDDAAVVAAMAGEIIDAHHVAGALCCVKHFPGHGCSARDSHLELPDITEQYDTARDLAPYRGLLDRGAATRPDMVMTAHLLDRNVDPEFPASLSWAHTTQRIRRALGWTGAIVTDSIDMGAVAHRWDAGEAAVLALSAGADMVMCACNPATRDAPHPAPALAQAIRKALECGQIAGGIDRLRAAVDRVGRLRAAKRPAQG